MTGVIKVKTTKEFGDSTVSKILDLVENSSMKKSRSEKFHNKICKIIYNLRRFAFRHLHSQFYLRL